MESIHADFNKESVVLYKQADTNRKNVVGFKDNRQAAISQRKIIQLLTAKRYFKGIKKGKKYNYENAVITNGIKDDAIGDDGFSTFQPGNAEFGKTSHYDAKFEIDNKGTKHGPVKELRDYYGHDTAEILNQPGHWSINKTPDKHEKTGNVEDLRTYATAKIELNDEYTGKSKRQHPNGSDYI